MYSRMPAHFRIRLEVSMLKGYTVPLSPKGEANGAMAPPWHYAGDVVGVEFWTDPAAAEATLPEGLSPDPETSGRVVAYFFDWQFNGENDEYLDPVYSQYREFFVLVDAHYDGQPVSWCPYIYVDNHHALARGLVQGFPKKIGQVHQTRVFASPGKASPTPAPGARFGASVSCDERTLAQARVTLEKPLEDPSPLLSRATINLRHFPTLEVGKYDKPAVHELVRMDYGDQQLAEVWIGSSEIEFYPAPREELADLRPVRSGMGFRGSMSYNVTQVFPLG
ncbi:acetoacetate decarboxylase family protein [Streptomyces nigra]|uniref:acetoacetate decarboxylase family protein n=1 Tax=Streptomyces nigra TaxID=1827580 RepID=UPI0034527B2E